VEHLANPQISEKQISGGHDINEFNTLLNKAGGTVISKIETGPGIYEIQYQLPNANRSAIKTVFDPVMYPSMNNMINTVANRALLEYQRTGNTAPVIQLNGINFDVRIAVRPGEPPSVRTAFPVGSAK
jgi:filamentous hemagglutinin